MLAVEVFEAFDCLAISALALAIESASSWLARYLTNPRAMLSALARLVSRLNVIRQAARSPRPADRPSSPRSRSARSSRTEAAAHVQRDGRGALHAADGEAARGVLVALLAGVGLGVDLLVAPHRLGAEGPADQLHHVLHVLMQPLLGGPVQIVVGLRHVGQHVGSRGAGLLVRSAE